MFLSRSQRPFALIVGTVGLWVILAAVYLNHDRLPGFRAADQTRAEPSDVAETAKAPLLREKEGFIQAFMESPITGSYGWEDLEELCSGGHRPWNPSVVFECPTQTGGVGNVRQATLQCLRYAIGARASFVIPRVARRNSSDVSDFQTQDFVSLDYMFDLAHLRRTMRSHCPQLVLHESIEDVGPNPENMTTARITPVDDLKFAPSDPGDLEPVIANAAAWPALFDEWLSEHSPELPTPSSPFRVQLNHYHVWCSWPTAFDPPELTRHFSELLSVQPVVYRLAASALHALAHRHHVTIPMEPQDLSESRGSQYLGVHLRVEKDAKDFHFTSYETQAGYLRARIQDPEAFHNRNITVVYVASGDRDGILRFQKDFPSVHVVSKHDLLDGDDLVSLNELAWDIQGLVDLLILERAGHMFGVHDSSFSWQLALRRAAAVNRVVGGYPRSCSLSADNGESRRLGCIDHLAESETWRDSLTSLVGDKNGPKLPWPKTMFP